MEIGGEADEADRVVQNAAEPLRSGAAAIDGLAVVAPYLDRAASGARLVIGTRSAVFAPIHNLGLVLVWDVGDDSLAEPRAPYPHAREVAMLRAHRLTEYEINFLAEANPGERVTVFGSPLASLRPGDSGYFQGLRTEDDKTLFHARLRAV